LSYEDAVVFVIKEHLGPKRPNEKNVFTLIIFFVTGYEKNKEAGEKWAKHLIVKEPV
jgi:hypothetical protein